MSERKLIISEELILAVLRRDATIPGCRVINNGLPEDARIVGARMQADRDLALTVISKEFQESAEPLDAILFERVHSAPTEAEPVR